MNKESRGKRAGVPTRGSVSPVGRIALGGLSGVQDWEVINERQRKKGKREGADFDRIETLSFAW